MSYITITYIDNTTAKHNTTSIDIVVSNKFLILKQNDVKTAYIPLCNIKHIEVTGAYKTIVDE